MEPQSKKPRVLQRFKPDYTAMWPCFVQSRVSENHARCTVCECDVSIGHGGKDDLRRHVKSKKHQETCNAQSAQRSVASFFVKPSGSTPTEDAVTNAELLFTKFIVEHNLPLSVADHAGPLFRKMFPTCEVAKKYASGRSKTTALTKHMGQDIVQELVKRVQSAPYSLATDGSHDGDEQLYPIVLRFFDEDQGKVVTETLGVKPCQGPSTGENIFLTLDRELKSHNISWQNCLAFSCDNASVMTGIHKGVSAFIQKENAAVHVVGCPCHLLHIAAKTGAKALHIDLEQVLLDIFHYLDKSTKRKKELQEFQKEMGTKLSKIIKHGPTRWLSLLDCVKRLLEQWEPLQAFVESEKATSKGERLKRLSAFFASGDSKLYALFLAENLPIFTRANLLLQRESPQIHTIADELNEVLTDLFVRFVRSKSIIAADNIFLVKHHQREHQLSRKELVIGSQTREELEKQRSSGKLSESQENAFFHDARRFFSGAAGYILDKLPVTEPLFENAKVLNVSLRIKHKFSMVQYFLDKFPCLMPTGADAKEQLLLEFNRYKVEPALKEIEDLPSVDRQWMAISKLNKADGMQKYPLLSAVMKGICCIPHSNADSERIFSLVRKNLTDFRPNLGVDSLSALIVQKVHMNAQGLVCHQAEFSGQQLAKAKKAYAASLK